MFKYIRILSIFLVLSLISVFIYKYRHQIPSPQKIVENIAPAPTIIEENGLPNKHLIKTAFVPQAPEKNWNEPWQDACEEAALLTVHYYYQNQNPDTAAIANDLKNLFNFETNQGWTSDINISQMATLWNYQIIIIDNPQIDDFKKYLSQNIPVIIPANGKILFTENSHFKSGGPWYHNLVVLGYDDTKNKFIVHDVGTQFGAYFQYSYNTLLKSIHDFPISLKKENINSGTPRILVLLK